ncbi:hypothetical protein [Phenylobacterium sp.]|uniref:hypothetical protein n=1 Tax=Phenylobacterium sp. TaxID=1871053 RepID=UPI002F926277
MAIVRLGSSGEVEVIEPATPEEDAAAKAGLHRLIALLVAMAIDEDRAAAVASQAARAPPDDRR